MIKSVLKRAFVFSLTLALIISVLPGTVITAFAAGTVEGHGVEFLSASSNGGPWKATLGTIEGSVTGTDGGMCSDASSATGTLTLTNTFSSSAILEFNFKLTANGGSAVINGKSYQTDSESHFAALLQNGESITVELTSAEASTTTEIKLTNISLTEVSEGVDVTFDKPENGTYTMNDEKIEAETTKNLTPGSEIRLEAGEADDGYGFLGWIDNDILVSQDKSFTTSVVLKTTIRPLFIQKESAALLIDSRVYTTWDAAMAAIEEAVNKTITLLADWTVNEENIEIPTGVMFLIPCKDGDTGYAYSDKTGGYSPDGSGTHDYNPQGTLYRTLTVPKGHSVTVNGTLLVNAVTGQEGTTNYDQDITGGFGQIKLGGEIVVESGGLLDSSGYVRDDGSGSGSLEVKSGGKAFDLYVVPHWRGGTAAKNAFSANIYPMNESKMHNIEVPTVIREGGILSGTVKMYVEKIFTGYHNTHFPQVDSGNGLFRPAENGYVMKKYENGREKLTLVGGSEISSSTLRLFIGFSDMDLSTGGYVYPFDGDMDIVIKDSLEIKERIKFMPGATVMLEEGAVLTVSEKTAKEAKDNLVVFYDNSFQDTYETSKSTRYPTGRGDAKLIMKGNTILTADGEFGGKITIDETTTEISPAAVTLNGGVSPSTKEMQTNEKAATDPITFTANIDGYPLETGNTYTCWKEDAVTIIKVGGDGTDSREVDYDKTNKAWPDAGEETLEYKVNGQWTANGPVDAGTYSVRKVTDSGEGYKVVEVLGTLTVKPIAVKIKWTDPESLEYDGTVKTVTAEVGNKVENDEVTVTLSGAAGADANTYTAEATGLEGAAAGNYTLGEGENLTHEWTVTPAPLTLAWSGTGVLYDGTPKNVTAEIRGVKNGDVLTVNITEGQEATDAGTYTAKAEITGEKVSNYTMPEDLTYKWTIEKADAPEIEFPKVTAAVTYDPGQTLEDIQLEGGSTQYGTFAWTDPQTVPDVKTKEYSVTFTPGAETVKNYQEIENTTAAVSVTVNPADQDAPDGLSVTQPTVIGGTGSISGADETMEYRKRGDNEWKPVGGNEIPDLEPGEYLVRYKAKENYNAGAETTLTVTEFDPAAEPQPGASIDYQAEKFTGLVSGEYRINELSVTADGSGRIDIDADWFGQTVSIVRKGNGETTTDSPAQNLRIPARPDAPTVTGGYTSAPGASDGKVKDLTEGKAYEYKADGGEWTALTGETGLAKGTYSVRLAATDSAFHSEEGTFTVLDPSHEDTPAVEIDHENEQLTGFAEGSYTVNGGDVTVENGVTAIDEGWFGQEIQIVKKSSGEAFVDSEPQTLSVPARPAAPEGLRGVTPGSPDGENGSIVGLDSEKLYEYRPADSGEWTPAEAGSASITGLKVGKYQVRTRGAEEAFASAAADVEVTYTAPFVPSTPGSKTETVTNPDGSTTTTTTDRNGTVTETTEQTDGTVTEKVTEKDGTVTETVTGPDGTVTEKVTQPDGAASEKTTTPEGVTGQVNTDAEGAVKSAEVVIPDNEETGKQDVVTAPVEVPASGDAETAPEISVKSESGETTRVEIPVTDVGPGTVAVVVHEDGTEEVVRDCVIGENGVVLNVEGDVTLKIVDNTETFADEEEINTWAADAVDFVAARELFSGNEKHEFEPLRDMTRGMLVTVLHRLAYDPDGGDDAHFADVLSGAWYAEAVAWAQAEGIVKGYDDGNFHPDDLITREQLVSVLYRYVQLKGCDTAASGGLKGFSDAGTVNDYAREAMDWAVSAGIVNGTGDGRLDPTGAATREQVAAIFMRFCEKAVK